jgi:hypothetical protein
MRKSAASISPARAAPSPKPGCPIALSCRLSPAQRGPFLLGRSARHRAAGYCFHFARSIARSSSRLTSELVKPWSIKASSNS